MLKIVDELDDECKSLKTELFRICWYMRGGVTIDEAYGLCFDDRMIISDIIKDNLETTKKTQLPFF